MATHTITRVLLVCDGCAAEHGSPDGHRTPTEARAAAYADGWRMPPLQLKSGKLGAKASDVCPACLPGWQPQRIERRSGYRRLDGTVGT